MKNYEKANSLYKKAIQDMKEWGFEFTYPLEKDLQTTDSVTFWGDCSSGFGKVTIRVNIALIKALDKHPNAFLSTLYHELAHAVKHPVHGNCSGHGLAWNTVAGKIRAKTDLPINDVTSDYSSLGIDIRANKPARYIIKCVECGNETPRYRASKITKNPQNYRCTCKGKLKVIDLT